MGWDLLGRTAQRLNYWSFFFHHIVSFADFLSLIVTLNVVERLLFCFFHSAADGRNWTTPCTQSSLPLPPGWLSGDDSTSWITWTGEQLRCWPTCRAVTCYRMKIDLTGGLSVETQHLCEYWFYLRENVKGSIPLLVPVWEVKLKWL